MSATPRERDTREAVVRYAQLVYSKGWVANHDGNLTARSTRGRIIATPTAMSKGDVGSDDLIVVNEDGERVSGRRRSFSEMALHLEVYREREDAQAVIHAHPPFATAMACAGVELGQPFIAEAIVSLGHHIPLVPFCAPKTPSFTRSLTPMLPFHDVVVMQNHGVISWGSTLEQAFLRMELVEHLASIATAAKAWGGTKPLPDVVVRSLLDARRRAGLGPESRGLELTPSLAFHSQNVSSPVRSLSSSSSPTDLTRIITEEIAAALSGDDR